MNDETQEFIDKYVGKVEKNVVNGIEKQVKDLCASDQMACPLTKILGAYAVLDP